MKLDSSGTASSQVEIRDEEENPESWQFAFLATSTPITVATDCRSIYDFFVTDFSFPEKNEGYPWVRVVLTPSTARFGVQDARATEDQGSDGAFVTGLLLANIEH